VESNLKDTLKKGSEIYLSKFHGNAGDEPSMKIFINKIEGMLSKQTKFEHFHKENYSEARR
jgi:hypothetical protein